MDTMIDVLENNSDFKVFCLDGGMVVMEDYLAIRPENKQKLIDLVKNGVTVHAWSAFKMAKGDDENKET